MLRVTVLVVDDEPQIRQAVRHALTSGRLDAVDVDGNAPPIAGESRQSVRVIEATTGRAAVDLVAKEAPALVVLDLGLPDMPGIDVCREIRRWSAAPIIVLSARHADTEKVALLDAGADDVISRPARRLELIARVNAVARRRARVSLPAPTLDGLVVDVDRHRATIAGRDLSLTPTELELLATLVARQGGIVDHRTLIRALWPDDPTVDHDVLRSHLGRLNQKLVAEGHPGLRNVRGRGYGLRIAGGALESERGPALENRAVADATEESATVADRAG